ncbi:hypothetical protein P168DRAFT_252089 [Aspergillus campestris IBT 28561]|uniref:Cellular morphogenesis protein n=1 Tax=Aspergillus campestris (strain IBT 28561) TaxID=1392248 RepID=A0A2I1D596_ASPC2|nr:uncharacterized protein P168DRAFT_252089 [Aspergillus campestris IBT 28561]PKY05038.1 hypothetical protein P168DRAFT_252089 [Aspergillus campestris IBT 28561]
MRASSLFGPAAAGLWTALIGLAASEVSFDSVSEPKLDLAPLGQIALTGDFAAVSLYNYEDQTESDSSKNGSQSILIPLPNGGLTSISSSDGEIRAVCSFTQKDGTDRGLFVAGNFTKLGGVKAQGAALLDPKSKKVTALPGLRGSVSALLCDQETDSVYAGGNLKYKDTSNVVAWTGSDGWKSLPFDGLNGPVTSILKNSDGHIVFGGSFDGVGNATSSKKHQQIVNLDSAKVTSDAESPQGGFSDPRNIICQAGGGDGEGKTWLLNDNSPGFWRGDMGFQYTPTKIRLYNTHFEGRGTKTFMLRALPDNGIMNLTYTDPNTNKKAFCDQTCELSHDDSEEYRDFEFVNSIAMQGFMLEIKDWYGPGAGLNGIQLFSKDILAYAVNDFNEPSCGGIENQSKSTKKGSWSASSTDQSSSGFLTAKVSDASASDTEVVLQPDVKQPGEYAILLYTPGCQQDGTCDSRGAVNVKATPTSDAADPIETEIYQTNLFDKYDTIYTGHVDASEDGFRPRVVLTPKGGQGDQTVVASKVKFQLIKASKGLSGELNGIYEFDPASKELDTDFTKSATNRIGLELDGKASIEALESHDNVIFAGGDFSSADLSNILFYEPDGNATALPRKGLNSEVSSMSVVDKVLYVGGNFTDTAAGGDEGLNHIAAFSLDDNKWSALGGGVNGPVSQVVSLSLNVSSKIDDTEPLVGISGDFDKLLSFDKNPSTNASGFAIWVPSEKNWLQNIGDSEMTFGGHLSAFIKAGNLSIIAGNVGSGGLGAAGAVALHDDDKLSLEPLLTPKKASGQTYAGVYDKSDGRNLTILGGRFTANGSDGSTVENIAVLDGKHDTITGLGGGIDTNSTFMALTVWENTLYAGGNVTGALGKTPLNGFIVYDLENKTFPEAQPPMFMGQDVSVNSIAARPGSQDIYFGGHFDKAGALPCPGVCYFDKTEDSWNRPGVSLEGSVLALKWVNKDTLMAVGDLQVDQKDTVVATYTVKGQKWKAFDGASKSDIPGTVTAFSPASADVNKFWLAGEKDDGTSFLVNYDGTKFESAGDDIFDKGTTIRGLEIIPLKAGHEKADLLRNDQTLLVTGQLMIPDFGHASAALYDGSSVTPFILSSKSDGKPGSMSQVFYENKNPYTSEGKHRSNGIVVLVSFCCALGCVFLIVIAGIIFNKIQRRRQGYMAAPQTVGTDRPSNMQRLPPEYLFNSLKQANPGTPAI